MKDYIRINKLFCNDYNAVILYEYTKEMTLLRKVIEIAEKAVSCKKEDGCSSFEGICYLFAKSIIDYAKMAYDNIVLGHFLSAHMIIRTMIENVVCLEIIINDDKEELWKYYFAYTYRNTMFQLKEKLPIEEIEFIDKMYSDYGISDDFYLKGSKKEAYIDKPYGWTYKVNREFNFKALCKLVNEKIYGDYKMMCEYSHGTSITQKIMCGVGTEHIMNMLSCIYSYVERLVGMYCWECIDESFGIIVEKLENRICGVLGIDL